MHMYAASTSMTDCSFCNADGDFLIVPQLGLLHTSISVTLSLACHAYLQIDVLITASCHPTHGYQVMMQDMVLPCLLYDQHPPVTRLTGGC